MALSLNRSKRIKSNQEIFEADDALSIQKYLENDLNRKLKKNFVLINLVGYKVIVYIDIYKCEISSIGNIVKLSIVGSLFDGNYKHYIAEIISA